MQNTMRSNASCLFAVMALVAFVTLLGVPRGWGIEWGGMVGPGGSFTLEADLGPCNDASPALIVDSASLDLNGFTVSSCVAFPNA